TICAYADFGCMLEHIPGLPDLILFWMNDVSVIRVSRCGITRGTLSGKHVLTLIWIIMTGGSFKIILNWAVLTPQSTVDDAGAYPAQNQLKPEAGAERRRAIEDRVLVISTDL